MIKKSLTLLTATTLLAAGTLTIAPSVAFAAGDSRSQAVAALTLPASSGEAFEVRGYAAAGKKSYRCTVTPHRPHLSAAELKKKRNSVVAKASIECPGADKALKVSIYGVLAKSTSKKISTLKIIDSVSTIVTVKEGGRRTVMVPAAKSKTHHAPGKKGMWFRASFSGKIVGESISNISANATDFVWLKNKKF